MGEGSGRAGKGEHSFAISQFVDDRPRSDWLGGDGIVISGTGGEISFEGNGDVEIHESTDLR